MAGLGLQAAELERVPPGEFGWPADDDPLRLPKRPISRALVAALLTRGAAVTPPGFAGPLGWGAGPRVILSEAGSTGVGSTGRACPLALDLLLVLLDAMQRSGGAAPINARLVLARKGYRRWGGERQRFERKLLDLMPIVEQLVLEADARRNRLLELCPRNVARTDFLVRPQPALAAEVRDGPYMELPVSVLRLDHRKNRGSDVLAKKLALAIAANGASGLWCARELLLLTGHQSVAGRSRRNHAAERLPDALRRLCTLGVAEVEGLEGLERSKAARRDWLDAEIWLRLRPPAECAPPPSGLARRVGATAHGPEGAPRASGARRGRPRFQPSAEQRRLVRTLHAAGATREHIAQALGVSLPTLRCYFAAEFHEGAAGATKIRLGALSGDWKTSTLQPRARPGALLAGARDVLA